MNIIGEKILLRAINLNDAEFLMDLINDPNTEKMLGGKSFPVSYEHQCKWIETQSKPNREILRCIIVETDNTEQRIGTIILNNIDYCNGTAEVHIKLDRTEVRKGYGTDALNTIVTYAFNEMRLNCVYAEILEYNASSIKLFEKCGFIREGILRSRVYKSGRYFNTIMFSKLREASEE